MTTTLAPAKKIMVVEDESVISLDIRNSLTKLGYTISGTAVSGDAALRKINNNRPDLILMDIHLKGEMTGIEVSQKVKSKFQIPIVYLTANADDSTFQDAQGTDPFGYILKPFAEKELGIAIEIALNKHQKEQVVKSSESWYATAFQSLSEAVVATDPHGYVVFMNAAAELITDWTLLDAMDKPITEIVAFQRKIQQFDTLSQRQSVNSILNEVLRTNAEVLFFPDCQLLTKSSKCIPVEGKATALRAPLGNTIGSLFTFSQVEASSELSSSQVPPHTSKKDLDKAVAVTTDQESFDQKSLIEKDDADLIATFVRAFINRQPISLSTNQLIASAGEGWAKLTSRSEGCVVRVSSIEDELTAIVTESSIYEKLIGHFMVENSFFPIRRRSSSLCHYQYCEIPEHTQVYRTDGGELWKVWHGNMLPGQSLSDRTRHKLSRKNIFVLRRGTWYRIQKLRRTKADLHIKTVGGEVFVSSGGSVIWGAKT